MDFNKLVEYVANNLTDEEKELIAEGENGKIGLHGEICERYGSVLVDNLITCGIIQAIPYCPYYYLSQLGNGVKDYLTAQTDIPAEDTRACKDCRFFVKAAALGCNYCMHPINPGVLDYSGDTPACSDFEPYKIFKDGAWHVGRD